MDSMEDKSGENGGFSGFTSSGILSPKEDSPSNFFLGVLFPNISRKIKVSYINLFLQAFLGISFDFLSLAIYLIEKRRKCIL